MLRESAKERTYEIAPLNLTGVDLTAVREQMQRMLLHPLFRSGRRCPALFQYVVENALEGNTALLKERIIGVEVFGRTPDYDTNADSVVRTSAAELRKRIAQYYQEPGHEAEVRIGLHSGSYVPDFRIAPEPPVPDSGPHPAPLVVAPPEQSSRARTWAPALFVVGLIACLAAALILKPWQPVATLDKFWGPVLESPGTVMLCVGQRLKQTWALDGAGAGNIIPSDPTPQPDVPLFKFYWMAAQNVALPDVITISKLSGLLQAKGKAFRVRPESTATFEDFRGGPAVLIGGFKNEWTFRVLASGRFSLAQQGEVRWIQDRDNPTSRNWTVDFRLPYTSITEDYAIVSRAVDPTTQSPIVVVAGIAGYGTMVAAEFLTDPAAIRAIEKLAPSNWEHRGLQLVLKTKVIGRSASPARVVAAQFW